MENKQIRKIIREKRKEFEKKLKSMTVTGICEKVHFSKKTKGYVSRVRNNKIDLKFETLLDWDDKLQ